MNVVKDWLLTFLEDSKSSTEAINIVVCCDNQLSEGQAYNASFNDSHQDDDMTKKVVNL